MANPRTGCDYHMAYFKDQGIIVIVEGRIEISREVIVDGKQAIALVWTGTLNDLIAKVTM